MEPRSNVPGYMASRMASRGVGRKGDPAIGGESTLVADAFDLTLPFDIEDGMGTSTFVLVL